MASSEITATLSLDEAVSRIFFLRFSNLALSRLRRLRGMYKTARAPSWEAETTLSNSFSDFFWLIDYPKTARGFYDREDEECPGILRDFDLFYPEGYGEAVSGGEREYKYERVVARMLSTGEVPETYRWYLEMLREGTTPSAGFGIGVERFTRYVCGRDYIWESVPFPKVPGISSP